MRKFWFGFGLVLASVALGSSVVVYDGISTERKLDLFTEPKAFQKYKTPLHKAIFTQRGYIQFLRWELPVPEIEEFTFCLWVKSTNLTYSHSIFSYSKNEQKRLVSSWISPFGRSIHLEVLGNQIIAHPTNLEENRWYHICQSWENPTGRYALWINGRIEIEGYSTQLIGQVIEKNGDIVVGQEYTDFDKGFEEGIEGAVLGFNLLLSSAFDRPTGFYPFTVGHRDANLLSVLSLGQNRNLEGFGFSDRIGEDAKDVSPRPEIQGRKILNENREGVFDSALSEYLGGQELLDKNLQGSGAKRQVLDLKFAHRTKRDSRRIRRRPENRKPLGLQLVDLTYNHCEIGRASPFIGGSKMLISWTRTPVKVFGGAILKNARSTCGYF